MVRTHTYKLYLVLAAIAVLAVLYGLAGTWHGIFSAPRSPLEATHRVRNISAQELRWGTATAAQPGDVIEHLLLIHLDAETTETVAELLIQEKKHTHETYRAYTLESLALGINRESAESKARDFFSSGLAAEEIAAGEFIDIRWQTQIKDTVIFDTNEAPLIAYSTRINARSFAPHVAHAQVSLYSTVSRAITGATTTDTTSYSPMVVGMSPRAGYDVLGVAVVIAGSDLRGIGAIRIDTSAKAEPMRIISNELLETAIPAGLSAGTHYFSLYDLDNKALPEKIEFTIAQTNQLPFIIAATPDTVIYGEARSIVLQGIGLGGDISLSLRDAYSKSVELSNVTALSDRVIAVEVPKNTQKGIYTLFVNNNAQEVHITIK